MRIRWFGRSADDVAELSDPPAELVFAQARLGSWWRQGWENDVTTKIDAARAIGLDVGDDHPVTAAVGDLDAMGLAIDSLVGDALGGRPLRVGLDVEADPDAEVYVTAGRVLTRWLETSGRDDPACDVTLTTCGRSRTAEWPVTARPSVHTACSFEGGHAPDDREDVAVAGLVPTEVAALLLAVGLMHRRGTRARRG